MLQTRTAMLNSELSQYFERRFSAFSQQVGKYSTNEPLQCSGEPNTLHDNIPAGCYVGALRGSTDLHTEQEPFGEFDGNLRCTNCRRKQLFIYMFFCCCHAWKVVFCRSMIGHNRHCSLKSCGNTLTRIPWYG